jgi:hypothetical protein
MTRTPLAHMKWIFALPLVAMLLAGCSAGSYDGPTGTVVGQGHSPAHYDPCASWAKVCFSGNVGARWYLEIQDDSDSGDAWVGVSQQAFAAYKIGDQYP